MAATVYPLSSATLSFRDVLDALERLDCRPTGHGDRFQAHCPAHDDNNQSLSVARGKTQPFLLFCHAGCSFDDVLAVISGEQPPVTRSGQRGRRRRSRSRVPPSRVVARYPYRDELGRLLYTKLRLEPKSFRFERPGGQLGLPEGQRRVPYNLPALAASQTGSLVFVVEGEKDADALISQGYLATTNDNGAGKWPADFARYLAGRIVVIIPDNDEAGRHHAELVATSAAGVAMQVRILELPDLPEKGDLSDWLAAGHGIEELLLLAYTAALWGSDEVDEEAPARPERDHRQFVADRSDSWPEAPESAVAGAVATIYANKVKLAPTYAVEGSYRDEPMKRHLWLIRRGNQILQEAEQGTVYTLELPDGDAYRRFKDRQLYRKGQGLRREYFAFPLTDGTFTIFHVDEEEGGEPVSLRRPALYKYLAHLLDHTAENGNPAGSADWGKDYRGSRGEGRAAGEEAVVMRAQFTLALVEARAPVRQWTGMEKMSTAEIRDLASEKAPPALVAMMKDELAGKQRKSVLTLLLQRVKMNSFQILAKGKGALRDFAGALGIKLNRSGRGGRVLSATEAYRRLVDTGRELITRTGRAAASAFLEWLLQSTPAKDVSRYSVHKEESEIYVQNNRKIEHVEGPEGATIPLLGATFGPLGAARGAFA